MGFYVRRSVKAGPFRFSVSKSGIGASVGVPGFRIGSGPRGNYVRIGGGMVRYRATARPRGGVSVPGDPVVARPSGDVVMEGVTGVTSLSLVPTGGGEIVEQLNVAATRWRWGWPVTIAAVILGLALLPYGLIVWALAAPLCCWLFLRDKARGTVVAFFDVSDTPARWFDALVTNWACLTGAERLWRVVESGRVRTTYQHKINAGASDLVKRIACKAHLRGPRHLSTNVAVPTLVSGRSSIHFLPDRVLIRDGRHYSDVAYGYLHVRGSSQRFIERPGRLATDSAQVDQTWQFVNVKGGPDRRYSNNRLLPVMLYGGLDLTSPQGLNWQIQISRADAASSVARVLGAAPVRRPG